MVFRYGGLALGIKVLKVAIYRRYFVDILCVDWIRHDTRLR